MTDLIKITVNLTAENWIALNAAADREGLNRTDTINRAIGLYAMAGTLAPGQAAAVAHWGTQIPQYTIVRSRHALP